MEIMEKVILIDQSPSSPFKKVLELLIMTLTGNIFQRIRWFMEEHSFSAQITLK